MRTYVRAARRHHPARRSRLVLRVGRAARRSRAARQAGDRRRRRGARSELRSEGLRRAHRDGRGPGPSAVPARARRARHACRPIPRPATPYSRCSTTPRRSSNRCRSTRPSSTCPGCAGCRAPRSKSRQGCGLRSATASGCRSPSASPAPSSSPRWPARRPSPTDCCWCHPTASWTFLHPLPVRRLWGVGAKTAEKLHAHGIETVADVAELSETTLAAMVGGAMGRQLFALSRNIDRRRVVTGVRRRSVGAQRALGRRGNTMAAAEIDAVVINLVDRITRRMRTAGRTGRTVVLRLRFDDFSRATRSHTMARATASTDVILDAARELVMAAAPLIAERGLTLVGFSVSQHRPRGCPAVGVAVRPNTPTPWHSTTPSTRCASATVTRRSPAACWSAAIQAWRCRTCRIKPVVRQRIRRAGRRTRRSRPQSAQACPRAARRWVARTGWWCHALRRARCTSRSR